LKAPKGTKPLKVPSSGREFGDTIAELPPRFKAVLERNMKDFKDRVQNPQKYEKPKYVPSILHPRGFTQTDSFGKEFRAAHTHMMPNS
jgi:hypothetical protein